MQVCWRLVNGDQYQVGSMREELVYFCSPPPPTRTLFALTIMGGRLRSHLVPSGPRGTIHSSQRDKES